jgi:hypothetical protein
MLLPVVPSLIQTVSVKLYVHLAKYVTSFVTIPTVGMEAYYREYIFSLLVVEARNA